MGQVGLFLDARFGHWPTLACVRLYEGLASLLLRLGDGLASLLWFGVVPFKDHEARLRALEAPGEA